MVGAPVQTEQSKNFPLGDYGINAHKDTRDNETQCNVRMLRSVWLL